jgi:hypothetical protein
VAVTVTASGLMLPPYVIFNATSQKLPQEK